MESCQKWVVAIITLETKELVMSINKKKKVIERSLSY